MKITEKVQVVSKEVLISFILISEGLIPRCLQRK